jgi:hypothetical protein
MANPPHTYVVPHFVSRFHFPFTGGILAQRDSCLPFEQGFALQKKDSTEQHRLLQILTC